MREGMDGLAMLAQQVLNEDPFDGEASLLMTDDSKRLGRAHLKIIDTAADSFGDQHGERRVALMGFMSTGIGENA